MKHNHATLQTLHQQEPCRQEQHSLFKTKLISSIVSNHLYKCPDAYKSQTLIRAFSLVPHIGSYKHTCTGLGHPVQLVCQNGQCTCRKRHVTIAKRAASMTLK